jgi:hypothetical protein
LPGTETQFLGLSVHSLSLYRLIYTGFFKKADNEIQLFVCCFCFDAEKGIDNLYVELTDLQSDRSLIHRFNSIIDALEREGGTAVLFEVQALEKDVINF